MDGLLINSEDVYTTVYTELLQKYGKPALTWDVKYKLQGRAGVDAAQIVIDHYGLPKDLTPQMILDINYKRQLELFPHCKFMPGALELVKYLKSKNFAIGLATSSSKKTFKLKTENLKEEFSLFGKHVITADDVPPGKSKPQPDIYLTCLKSINDERILKGEPEISIEECLVFEDGRPGVVAGITAGAYVIWVPDKRAVAVMDPQELAIIGKNNEYGVILGSLEELNKEHFGLQ
ncbi:hypothetical protein PACTADRAFT_73238 [Pachysolen tannophilus NRRL Y-2460]|nr:hypothetical protein PACTADRAFT_73238 [Pachysolen tannophilus NRRL Y-2460]